MTELPIPSIYLASQSPRRSALLTAAGIPFELLDVDFDESYPPETHVRDIAEYIAQKKAQTAIRHIKKGIILTADSVVIHDNKLYGKPADRKEAVEMLSALEGETHTVVTGVCLISAKRERLFSSITEVQLAPMTSGEIDYYVDQYQPFDKAGAYAIQEWLGHTKVTKITGSYNNVMGLPTHLVYEALQNFPS